jgi:hypothetical protein
VIGVAGGAALAGQVVEAGSPAVALLLGAGQRRHRHARDRAPSTTSRSPPGHRRTGCRRPVPPTDPVVGTPATPEDAGVQVGVADEVVRGVLAERVSRGQALAGEEALERVGRAPKR